MDSLTLRSFEAYCLSEEAKVDAAVDKASFKDIPPLSKMALAKVEAESGQLIISGTFGYKDTNFGSTQISIDAQTFEGTGRSHFFLSYTGTSVFGSVGKDDVKALAKRAQAAIDAGNIAASSAARSILVRVIACA